MFSTLVLLTVAAGGLLFVCERLWPAVPGQGPLRRGLVTDFGYWVLLPPVSKELVTIVFALATQALVMEAADPGAFERWATTPAGHVAALPWPLRIIFGLAVYDFATYWAHRLCHTKALWPLHAIHHSPTELDWFSTARIHPLQTLIMRCSQGGALVAAGFPMIELTLYFFAGTVSSYLLHANIRWDYGPLSWLLTSPAVHRWHHTAGEEGRDRNFALIFTIYDWLFGTYYYPVGRLPEQVGAPGDAPRDGFWAQMAYPLRHYLGETSHADRAKTASRGAKVY